LCELWKIQVAVAESLLEKCAYQNSNNLSYSKKIFKEIKESETRTFGIENFKKTQSIMH